MKRFRWWALLLAAAFTVTACGGAATAPGGNTSGSAKPVPEPKIGVLLPSTGDLGDLGKPMVAAAQFAIDQVNKAGGIWGGKQIKLVIKDSGTSETKARDGMDQLVNVDKVSAVVGAAGSGESKAALPLAVAGKVPMCSPSSTSPYFTTADDKGMFLRTAPSDALQGKIVAEVAIKNGYKKAAVMALNNPYGQGLAEVFVKNFTASGGTMVLDPVLYDPKGSTFKSEVQKVTAAKPDVVILIGYPDTGSVILKEAYQEGLMKTAKFILTDGMRDAKLASQVGKDASGKFVIAGTIGTAPASTGPGFEAFKAGFGADKSGGVFTANTYDCAILEALALAKVGPDKAHDGAAIAQAMIDIASPPGDKVSDLKQALQLVSQGKDINFEGASSSLDMDSVGDVLSDYELWQIQDDGSIKTTGTVKPQ